MSSQHCAGETSGQIQFPHPTRPINSDNKSSIASSEPLPSLLMPQPMRPVSGNKVTSANCESYATECRFRQQFIDDHSGVRVHVESPTEEEDGEALGGLTQFISEIRGKVPARIADRLPNMKGTKGPVTVQRGSKRGVQGSIHELLTKLGRFKIRTFDLGGVTEEKDKR